MPEPVRVKICGLTRPDEALAAARLGAWAIGLVFAPESPRRVGAAQAADVGAAVPRHVQRVGVFVNPSVDDVAEAVEAAALTHVQVHGVVDVNVLRAAVGVPVIQGFAVASAADLDAARASEADLVILDASMPGRHGGTGTTFDWELLEHGAFGRPFILAGGLTATNVADAIVRARPDYVDVSSGVESAPGRKDPERIEAFLDAARSVATVRGTA